MTKDQAQSEITQKLFVLDALWKLDDKMKAPAVLSAWVYGIAGVILMILALNYWNGGIGIHVDGDMHAFIINVLGAVGLAMVLTVYFIYKWVLKLQRKKYTAQILQLAEKLTKDCP